MGQRATPALCLLRAALQGAGRLALSPVRARALLLLRLLLQIFDTSRALAGQGWSFVMQASMLEIYNEEYKDLLTRSKKDDKKHQVGGVRCFCTTCALHRLPHHTHTNTPPSHARPPALRLRAGAAGSRWHGTAPFETAHSCLCAWNMHLRTHAHTHANTHSQVIHNQDGSTTVTDLTLVDVSTAQRVRGVGRAERRAALARAQLRGHTHTQCVLHACTHACTGARAHAWTSMHTSCTRGPFPPSGREPAVGCHGEAVGGVHGAQRALLALPHGVHAQHQRHQQHDRWGARTVHKRVGPRHAGSGGGAHHCALPVAQAGVLLVAAVNARGPSADCRPSLPHICTHARARAPQARPSAAC